MVDKSVKQGIVEFGIGVVSYVAVDAIANAIKNLEKEGKLNRKEGEKMMRDAVNKYQAKSSEYAKDIQSRVDELMKAGIKSAPFATKQDIENLNAKIERLSKLSKKTNVKRVAKKGSKKRSK